MLKAKLVVVGGDAKSTEVNLRLPCVIGRGREATLTLPHPLVSRRHCEIVEKDGRLFVRDLGSLNGTYVNNKRIEKIEPLDPNQLLTLGNVTFRAVYKISEDVVPASAPTEQVQATEKSEQTIQDEERHPVVIGSNDQALIEDKETVYEDQAASDTDQSLPSMAPFGGSKEDNPTEQSHETAASEILIEDSSLPNSGDQSVSASAIDALPSGPASATSFVGKVDFGDEQAESAVESKVRIELDDQEKTRPVEDDSGLDSFINKLPR